MSRVWLCNLATPGQKKDKIAKPKNAPKTGGL